LEPPDAGAYCHSSVQLVGGVERPLRVREVVCRPHAGENVTRRLRRGSPLWIVVGGPRRGVWMSAETAVHRRHPGLVAISRRGPPEAGPRVCAVAATNEALRPC